MAFTLGVTLAISATVVYMRDLRIALPLMIQLGLFVTPVAYGIGTIASTRDGIIIFSALNPLAPVIDGLRRTVLLGQGLDWASTAAGRQLPPRSSSSSASCSSSASKRDSPTLPNGTISTAEVWKRFRVDNRPTYLQDQVGRIADRLRGREELRLAVGAARHRASAPSRANPGA